MSEALSFVKPDSVRNVYIRSDAIIGFDSLGSEYKCRAYRVYLLGGGSIDVRAGQLEYERLTSAIKGWS